LIKIPSQKQGVHPFLLGAEKKEDKRKPQCRRTRKGASGAFGGFRHEITKNKGNGKGIELTYRKTQGKDMQQARKKRVKGGNEGPG